uniref:Ubiquinone/menaquinone biosynthesis C-methylase UbiE n=1 Tax=Candidatus Kentrum sp. FM TaxID=2126340 RepID=A0A450S4M3_9GAMM|nr:MAG: Ubiquinone/menaquinone biosynthesis C-methylase UbiE [Candidatus Kentron sp. FM]VFJ47751.1 MAG: Ubiquinone/menaquinone biosynthesis C-methylase UbiE [Candidatus Kentron sp. FM]VFK07947.1 MAG: Ubiquinone/menaquinone biosynthesis C-methylase UbiE [Candidatus Kentron sp. FM]
MKAVYDDIAEQYQKASDGLPFRQYAELETYFHVLGGLSGKSILDLACGEGFYTRELKQKGVAQVVGVDISKEMLELAMREEKTAPLGIEYRVGDVLDLGRIGEFDRVVATYLLNYARTREELLKMCRNIYLNLKPGGRFVTINNNNEQPPNLYKKLEKYGSTCNIFGPLEDGTPITIILKPGSSEELCFDVYYLSNATHESVFREAGFKEIIWHPVKISPEGIQKFGQEYWQDFLENPVFVCMECVK